MHIYYKVCTITCIKEEVEVSRYRGTADSMKIYIELFLTFAKIGVMTFGGGMAMLPMLQREIVENKHWADEDELADYYAIGQCTPGIIAVNTATFIGNKLAGISGGLTATAGIVFTSLVIIMTLASIIAMYSHLPVVENAFAGIQVAVCVLIFNSVVKLSKSSVVDRLTALIFILVLAGSFLIDISPVFFVLAAAVVGILAKNKEA